MITLKNTIAEIKGDLKVKQGSGIRSFIASYLYDTSFRVLLNYRLGKYFINKPSFFLRQLGKYYRSRLITKRNCYISYKSKIGQGLKLAHPIGIVIGDGVVIKNNVTIFQQVTLGSHGKGGLEFNYPIIESGVKIFAGAKIIGGVTIGENAIIGANSVVNIDIPANAIAVGVPCRILNK